jgi:hypothetical protein
VFTLSLSTGSAGLVRKIIYIDNLRTAEKRAFETLKEKRFMDPTTNGASGSTQAGGSNNIAQL